MKFLIFFMLVGLGHGQLNTGEVKPAVDCATALVASSPDTINAVATAACGLIGGTTEENRKVVVDNLNVELNKVAQQTSCATESLLDTQTSKIVNDLGATAEDTAAAGGDILGKVGIGNNARDLACALVNTTTGTQCYKTVVEGLKQDLQAVKTPAQSIVGMLQCQAQKKLVDLKTIGGALQKGDCLQAVPDNLDIAPKATQALTSSATILAGQLVNGVGGLVDGLTCAVNTLTGTVSGAADGLTNGGGLASGGLLQPVTDLVKNLLNPLLGGGVNAGGTVGAAGAGASAAASAGGNKGGLLGLDIGR